MSLQEISKNVPTDKDILALEKKLNEMKQAREDARRAVFAAMKSDDILGSLGRDELISLMRRIQSRIVGPHRKVRGSRVPDELKTDLIKVLNQPNPPPLSQLAAGFNLSISYISRVKAALKEQSKKSKGKVINAYEDHQLNFPAREEQLVPS